MRAGDFSALGVTIYDPATTIASGNSYTGQTFTQEYNEGPGNTASVRRRHQLHPSKAGSVAISTALSVGHPDRQRHPGQRRQPLLSPQGPMLRPAFRNASGGPELRQQQPGHVPLQPVRSVQNSSVGHHWQCFIHVPGHNYIGHWTHTFSPTAFSDVYFGRNYGYTYTGTCSCRRGCGVYIAVEDTRDVSVLYES